MSGKAETRRVEYLQAALDFAAERLAGEDFDQAIGEVARALTNLRNPRQVTSFKAQIIKLVESSSLSMDDELDWTVRQVARLAYLSQVSEDSLYLGVAWNLVKSFTASDRICQGLEVILSSIDESQHVLVPAILDFVNTRAKEILTGQELLYLAQIAGVNGARLSSEKLVGLSEEILSAPELVTINPSGFFCG
ncbi:hypothetical protein COT42_04170 [Candidatus Saganbacteria bacterium CG08_land_8_20_14_0_20_45_16]|uniref:Uncharacterized protein n=1 Tax=Candidatus Saganbacteria bacterium CG08_land_8_20_14_0_20_45_16 TaxID=2014293 RepID=A0A2H0XYA2_UNCSA|nr:MAG: hypothetical protein COT42_04170 [Candidatus Saganbacteria bacterium CG08_land_8_20_14_0_20_45_16]